jgi:hypothetical protein
MPYDRDTFWRLGSIDPSLALRYAEMSRESDIARERQQAAKSSGKPEVRILHLRFQALCAPPEEYATSFRTGDMIWCWVELHSSWEVASPKYQLTGRCYRLDGILLQEDTTEFRANPHRQIERQPLLLSKTQWVPGQYRMEVEIDGQRACEVFTIVAAPAAEGPDFGASAIVARALGQFDQPLLVGRKRKRAQDAELPAVFGSAEELDPYRSLISRPLAHKFLVRRDGR